MSKLKFGVIGCGWIGTGKHMSSSLVPGVAVILYLSRAKAGIVGKRYRRIAPY